jgi:hypothetical protein
MFLPNLKKKACSNLNIFSKKLEQTNSLLRSILNIPFRVKFHHWLKLKIMDILLYSRSIKNSFLKGQHANFYLAHISVFMMKSLISP